MEFSPQLQTPQARSKGSGIFLKSLFFIASLALIFSSCDPDETREVLHDSIGLPGEVMVVIPREQWDGPIGDTLRSELMGNFPMILQKEPMFTLIQREPDDFSAIDRANRNIIMVQVSDKVEENRAKQTANRWARQQMVYSLHATNSGEFNKLWQTYAGSIVKDMRLKDRQRIATYYDSYEQLGARKHLRETMGVEVTLHRDFQEIIVREDAASFLKERVQYLSGRPHDIKQGVVVYTYPYDTSTSLSADSLNAKRDQFLGEMITSANDAPMTIEYRLPPTYERVPHDSLYAIESRGLWRMEDPLQGGTFVSLTVVDEKNARVVTADGYVYSPQFDKRPLLLEIEALVYSLNVNPE